MTMAEEERIADWERGLLDEQVAKQRRAAALRAGRAVLNAYQHGMLPISSRYLADTLLMVLHVVGDEADSGA
jgi:hypothetical protein